MRPVKSVGRTIGILQLLQLAAGLTIPFILMGPLNVGAPGFLTTAAENSFQIRAAILIAFAGAALTLSIAIIAFPVFRRYSIALAVTFLAVCVISCTLDASHNASVMSMLSLSQQSGEAGADKALYEAMSVVAVNSRRWAHYSQLFAVGGWLFVFYVSLWRCRLIPRLLAGLGLIGVALQFTGVTLLQYVGFGSVGYLAMPLLPIHLATSIWLLVMGFRENESPDDPGSMAASSALREVA